MKTKILKNLENIIMVIEFLILLWIFCSWAEIAFVDPLETAPIYHTFNFFQLFFHA